MANFFLSRWTPLALIIIVTLSSSRLHAQTFEEKAQAFSGNSARVVTHTVVNPQQQGLSREIRRIYVPILPGQGQSFVDTFCSGDSCVLMARTPDTNGHPYHKYTRVLTRTDGNITAWSSTSDNGPINVGNAAAPFVAHQVGARYVVANLGEASLNHALTFLRTFRGSKDITNTAVNGRYWGISQYLQAKQAAGQTPGDIKAECMWWLPNLETSTNQTLTQFFGCKRTRGPQEVVALASHGATTASVPVIGVAVDSLEAFLRLTDDVLRGPKPTNGAYGSWIR